MNIIKGLPAFSIVASCNDYIEDVDVAIACILGRGIKKPSRGNFYSQREKRGLRELSPSWGVLTGLYYLSPERHRFVSFGLCRALEVLWLAENN